MQRRRDRISLLGKCSVMMLACYFISGSYLMDITELQRVQPYTFLRFSKASTSYNLSVISGLRIGLKLTGQHAVLPEGKGKGKGKGNCWNFKIGKIFGK